MLQWGVDVWLLFLFVNRVKFTSLQLWVIENTLTIKCTPSLTACFTKCTIGYLFRLEYPMSLEVISIMR